jgi:hypothetical protein
MKQASLECSQLLNEKVLQILSQMLTFHRESKMSLAQMVKLSMMGISLL